MIDVDSMTSVLARDSIVGWQELTPELREAMKPYTRAFGGEVSIHDSEAEAKSAGEQAMQTRKWQFVSVYPLANSWVCSYHEAERQAHRRYLA